MKKLITGAAILLTAAAMAGLLVLNSAYEASIKALTAAESAVVLNEAMPGNKGIYLDDEGKSSDWVELYNPPDEAVNLGRFSLSDDEAKLDEWTFPDSTLEPHSYMVVYLSGHSQKDGGGGILHASFKLRAEGEELILSAAGNVVDSVKLPAMPDNASYGRMNDVWQLTDSPTPGEPNGGTAE